MKSSTVGIGAFFIFLSIVLLALAVHQLEQRVATLESNMFPPVKGPPGRRGGMKNGVWGSYSSVAVEGRYHEVFVPFKTQPKAGR